MRHVPFIDATGINRLKEICHQLQARGTTILISGANPDVREEFLKGNLYTTLGEENIHNNIAEAIQRAEQILNKKP